MLTRVFHWTCSVEKHCGGDMDGFPPVITVTCCDPPYRNGWLLPSWCLVDRKRCPWWARTSPYLSRPIPQPPPCTWRSRWRHPVGSARHPSRALSPMSRSGRGQGHRTLGKESTSMEPGESGGYVKVTEWIIFSLKSLKSLYSSHIQRDTQKPILRSPSDSVQIGSTCTCVFCVCVTYSK